MRPSKRLSFPCCAGTGLQTGGAPCSGHCSWQLHRRYATYNTSGALRTIGAPYVIVGDKVFCDADLWATSGAYAGMQYGPASLTLDGRSFVPCRPTVCVSVAAAAIVGFCGMLSGDTDPAIDCLRDRIRRCASGDWHSVLSCVHVAPL